jgi:glycosyltransferase involved in cell wall biosynthesis
MKFTIGIPAYKAAFLAECLDSILEQTYTDFEIVIVDDASPEDLDSIVHSYKDARIRYYKNEQNIGALNVVDNWNKCLSYAGGEFFICMGDDDKLLPNCLDEYAKLIDRYPTLDIYHGWTEMIDEESNFVRLQEARPEYESVYSMIWHRWNGRIQFVGDFLFRTSTLKEKGGFYKLPLAWASDDITACLMAEDKGIANTQSPVFQYRNNSQTISNTGAIPDKMKAVELEEEWYCRFFGGRKSLNEIDKKFLKMSERNIQSHFIKKRISLIKSDFLSGKSILSKLFYWSGNKQEFKITFAMVLKGYLDAILVYFSGKYKKRYMCDSNDKI